MKRVYWRPPGVSRRAMLLITALSVAILVAVELLPVETRQPWYEAKLQAAHLARQAMGVIKAEKSRLGITPDPDADPHATGMLGVSLSPVTSNTGYLSAKRASVNPNFAAVIVDLLRGAGVAKGDLVGLGLSGSFPSLNISAIAAVQALQLDPIIISSASASQWGANNPELLWVDMERVLFEQQVLLFRSVAASLGGIDDRGYGMSESGRQAIAEAITRNNLHLIEPDSLTEAIDQRMDIYQQYARGRPMRAYVNIGGGSASVGTHLGKKLFRPGLNLDPPRGKSHVDSVMTRLAERDVPIIHVTNIERLAARYGLDRQPEGMPNPGEGNVFYRLEYNRWLAGGGILLILAVMLAFIRMDVGMRILRGVSRGPGSTRHPEPMV